MMKLRWGPAQTVQQVLDRGWLRKQWQHASSKQQGGQGAHGFR